MVVLEHTILMITFLKLVIGIILLCGIPGTIMGLTSAYKAGQLKPYIKKVKEQWRRYRWK